MALRRKDRPRLLKHRFLIVCEGKLESVYFNRLKGHPRFRKNLYVSIECVNGGKHFTVLARAKQLKKTGRFNCIWCVFDAECDADRPAVGQTIQDCRKSAFQVAISNPCFNIWMLAHLGAWPRGRTNPDKSRREMNKLFGCALKLDNNEWFDGTIFNGAEFPNLETARKAARGLSVDQVLDNNPCTTVPLLINALLDTSA